MRQKGKTKTDEFINRIIQGDSREVLQYIPKDSIDLTVTSPPYDNLRTYNNSSEWNFEVFKEVADQLYRVTKKGGVVVWVVGDATIKGSETGSSFKQALYFKEIGFNLHDTMIYEKHGPPLTHNRYEQRFEFMFVLSKGKPKIFKGITEQSLNAGAKRMGTMRQDSDLLGNRSAKGYTKPEKLKGNIWRYSVGNGSAKDKIAHKHPAIFPEQLAHDHIISWSNEGDVVLDPFAGSGTTCKMAKKLGRDFIGIEIDEQYKAICEERVRGVV